MNKKALSKFFEWYLGQVEDASLDIETFLTVREQERRTEEVMVDDDIELGLAEERWNDVISNRQKMVRGILDDMLIAVTVYKET